MKKSGIQFQKRTSINNDEKKEKKFLNKHMNSSCKHDCQSQELPAE